MKYRTWYRRYGIIDPEWKTADRFFVESDAGLAIYLDATAAEQHASFVGGKVVRVPLGEKYKPAT